MAVLLYLSAVVLLSLHQISSASQCPAFASAKASCGETTCGHFVFKGKFDLGSSRVHRTQSAKHGLRLGHKAAPGDCCRKCRGDPSCSFWNFFAAKGACYLYTSELCPASGEAGVSKTSAYVPNVDGAYVGGKCNGGSDARGVLSTGVSFPLMPERTFCLLSDPDLHINMNLGGYMDERTDAVGSGGKPRVWIREIGFVWKAKDGVRHTLTVVARRAAQGERGDGFLERIEVDGTAVPTMMLGDEVNLFDGQASILFDSYEKAGSVDVDRYSLRLDGILEADLFVRPAHPLLRHKDDAMVHLNLDIAEVQHSPAVHGILGQTYHNTKENEESNLDYNVLSQLISGTAASQAPFALEGRAEDYWSTGLLQPDCKFSQFGKAAVAAHGELRADPAAEAVNRGADEEAQAEVLREAEEVAATLMQEGGDSEVALVVRPGSGKPAQVAKSGVAAS